MREKGIPLLQWLLHLFCFMIYWSLNVLQSLLLMSPLTQTFLWFKKSFFKLEEAAQRNKTSHVLIIVEADTYVGFVIYSLSLKKSIPLLHLTQQASEDPISLLLITTKFLERDKISLLVLHPTLYNLYHSIQLRFPQCHSFINVTHDPHIAKHNRHFLYVSYYVSHYISIHKTLSNY